MDVQEWSGKKGLWNRSLPQRSKRSRDTIHIPIRSTRQPCSCAESHRDIHLRNGNKRTGFLIATFYLKVMGYPIPYQADDDEVVDFCVHISAEDIRDVGEIAQELRRFWTQA